MPMIRFLSALAVAALLTGCRCGTFRHQTGLEWDLPSDDDPPDKLDDYTLYEICGADQGGSFGTEDLLGDGLAWVDFDGTHDDIHVALITSGIINEVYFPTADLVAGKVVEIVEAYAYVVTMGGESVSGAEFTGGEVEILEVSDETDDIWDTRDYRMRWDLTWGEEGVTEFWYVASGEDWVPMTIAGSGI